MVVAIYKYTIVNNLTKNRKKRKKKHTQTNGMYLTSNIIYIIKTKTDFSFS